MGIYKRVGTGIVLAAASAGIAFAATGAVTVAAQSGHAGFSQVVQAVNAQPQQVTLANTRLRNCVNSTKGHPCATPRLRIIRPAAPRRFRR
jgi:hypothetical protein